MVNHLRRKGVFIALFACILVLCVAMVCVNIIPQSAQAADEILNAREENIAHITDTHYYPFRLGYYGSTTTTSNHDFFYNYIMDKSTKLWLEAEAVFDNALLTVKDEMPDYLVLSGDVAQDGELLAHIDLGNKLRALQNEIRAESGNDNFQIFVVMGNHDLYNPESYRFDNAQGLKERFYYTTRMDVAYIYAGLGYPNITATKAAEYYSHLSDDLQGQYAFVQSYLSSNFDWAWEFVKDDAEGNTRFFTYDSTASEAEKESVSMDYLLSNNLVKTIDNSSYFAASGQSYLYDKFGYGLDIDVGELTFIGARKDGDLSFLGMDVVLSNVIGGHVLGGLLQNSSRSFIAKNASTVRPDNDAVIIGAMHHSLIPHWEMEEEITTGFIVYNWVETADFLADYGMRYVYTGHMHANDHVSYVSFNGNQIVDIEGSSNASVGSAVKITRVVHGRNSANKLAEKTYVRYLENKNVSGETANVQLFSKVFQNDKYGYVAKNKINEFLDYGRKVITNYSGYSQRRVYDNAIVNKLGEFLRPDIADMLGDLVGGINIKIGAFNLSLGTFSADVVQLAKNLLKKISTDILKDYTYKGSNALYKIEENKVFGYVEEMVMSLVNYELAEGVTVFDFFMGAYISHNAGTEVKSFEEYTAAQQAALNRIYSGEFVEVLFDTLLDREKGLYRLIEGLQNTTLDLSEGISSTFRDQLALIGGVVGFSGENKLDLSKFNLGNILKTVGSADLVKNLIASTGFDIDLSKMTLTEVIDDIVSKYLTKSFCKALGEYAHDIIKSFGVDEKDPDPLTSNEMLLTIREFDDADARVFTYLEKTRTEVITVENGKKPDMIAINFGQDPSTSMAFTYFTDRRVNAGGIEFVETNEDGTYNKNAATFRSATTQIYGTTKPLIDLGIWCQSGYVELGRHTITLTNLKPGTTYAYRLGDRSRGYWSDWYTFTTAPSAEEDFEVLIGSDLQSSTRYAYERLSTIYGKLDQVFEGNIAFMINPGDAVDNGRNLSQYRWWLNSATEFYASTPMAIAAGNHDEKSFAPGKAGNMAYYGGNAKTSYFVSKENKTISDSFGASAGAMISEYNYLYTHFNYNLPAAQAQKTGFYYSFNYGGVHFIVLNTNDIDEDNKLAQAQYDWLVADLDAAEDMLKVVIMHKSLYSAGSHSYDKDVVGMRAQLTPLFAEKGVSVVIGGHDHTYSETYYLDAEGKKIFLSGGKDEITGEGVLYLTMGTMGEKFYNYVSNPNVPVNTGYSLHDDDMKLSDPTFGKLKYDAANKKLYYYGYEYLRELDELGNLIDGEIVKIKKSSDWNTLIAIILLGLVAVLVVVAVISAAVHNAKIRKVRD